MDKIDIIKVRGHLRDLRKFYKKGERQAIKDNRKDLVPDFKLKLDELKYLIGEL